jgi:hypothetical protein
LAPLVVHWAKEIDGARRMSKMYSFFMGWLFVKQIYVVGALIFIASIKKWYIKK